MGGPSRFAGASPKNRGPPAPKRQTSSDPEAISGNSAALRGGRAGAELASGQLKMRFARLLEAPKGARPRPRLRGRAGMDSIPIPLRGMLARFAS